MRLTGEAMKSPVGFVQVTQNGPPGNQPGHIMFKMNPRDPLLVFFGYIRRQGMKILKMSLLRPFLATSAAKARKYSKRAS